MIRGSSRSNNRQAAINEKIYDILEKVSEDILDFRNESKKKEKSTMQGPELKKPAESEFSNTELLREF